MKKVSQREFLNKLFQQDREGKEIFLNTKDYVYRDIKTNEIFGEIKPQVHGFKYYLN